MKALVTGAGSGIGKEMAQRLSQLGYDIIAVARRRERLEALALQLPTEVTVIVADLSDEKACRKVYEKVKNEDIEIVVNNAGFGIFGEFEKNSLERELEMLDVNCRSVHIFMKLFLKKFCSENRGYILNVCSIGGFFPGPLLAAYYASKAYVLSLTEAAGEELRRSGKRVYVGCLCPGPVDTEFAETAGVKAPLKSRSPERVCEYALKMMFRKKRVILPGIDVKLGVFLSRFAPRGLLLKIGYYVQGKKYGN